MTLREIMEQQQSHSAFIPAKVFPFRAYRKGFGIYDFIYYAENFDKMYCFEVTKGDPEWFDPDDGGWELHIPGEKIKCEHQPYWDQEDLRCRHCGKKIIAKYEVSE